MTVLRLLPLLLLSVAIAHATEFEESKSPHPKGPGLSTVIYTPTKTEEKFVKKTPRALMDLDGLMGKDMLKKKKGDYIAWFAIVRDIEHDSKTHHVSFVGESKHANGMSDAHLQTISIKGGGDFVVLCDSDDYELVPATLARVYGRIKEFDKEGRPVVEAEYVRVWPWGFFNFMDYGDAVDTSNPKRLEGLHLEGLRIYSSHPEIPQYYQERLAVSQEELMAIRLWWLKNENRIQEEDKEEDAKSPTPKNNEKAK